MIEYEKGYNDALDDVSKAMDLAERDTLGPMGHISFNDPVIFVKELKKLRIERFPVDK